MKKYESYIIPQETLKKIIGTELVFTDNGFVDDYCDTLRFKDWLGMLEEYLNRPIVSVRPSGRPSWKEVIVLCADGYINANDGTRILDYSSFEELQNVLLDIFPEHDVNETEVFEFYSSTCDNAVWEEVKRWVENTF